VLIKLQPNQKNVRAFKHPLLDGKVYINPPSTLIEAAQRGDANAISSLIDNSLPLLRSIIGRYLYHWPATRRFEEDMVSVGICEIAKTLNNLPETDNLGYLLMSRVCAAIEDDVNRMLGIVSASPRTNRRRESMGLDPILGLIEAALEDLPLECTDSSFEIVDILDLVKKLQGEFYRLETVLQPRYWGLTDSEISQELDIPRRTVSWYRQELWKRYLELVEE